MNSPRKYASAAAFRAALESRLKKLALEESIDLQRMRRQVVEQRAGKLADALREDLPPVPVRNAAFRRKILEVYDYRCAACGVRVKLTEQLSLVEAAHLIPFEVSPNDKSTNGMALCPNHHWAMDRYLIAPCPDAQERAGVWKVNNDWRRLDERIEGQRELIALAGKPVIPPSEEKFYPALESLRWREERLVTTYK